MQAWQGRRLSKSSQQYNLGASAPAVTSRLCYWSLIPGTSTLKAFKQRQYLMPHQPPEEEAPQEERFEKKIFLGILTHNPPTDSHSCRHLAVPSCYWSRVHKGANFQELILRNKRTGAQRMLKQIDMFKTFITRFSITGKYCEV